MRKGIFVFLLLYFSVVAFSASIVNKNFDNSNLDFDPCNWIADNTSYSIDKNNDSSGGNGSLFSEVSYNKKAMVKYTILLDPNIKSYYVSVYFKGENVPQWRDNGIYIDFTDSAGKYISDARVAMYPYEKFGNIPWTRLEGKVDVPDNASTMGVYLSSRPNLKEDDTKGNMKIWFDNLVVSDTPFVATQEISKEKLIIFNDNFNSVKHEWTNPAWLKGLAEPVTKDSCMTFLVNGNQNVMPYKQIEIDPSVKKIGVSCDIKAENMIKWRTTGISIECFDAQSNVTGQFGGLQLDTAISGTFDFINVNNVFDVPKDTKYVRFYLISKPGGTEDASLTMKLYFDNFIVFNGFGSLDEAKKAVKSAVKFVASTGDEKGVFYKNEIPYFNLTLSDYSNTETIKVKYKVTDFYGNEVINSEKNIDAIANKELISKISLPKFSKNGWYAVDVEFTDKNKNLYTSKTSLAITEFAPPNNFYGMTCFGGGAPLATKKMGLGVYAHQFRWRTFEEAQGKFDFTSNDKEINTRMVNGCRVIGFIDMRYTPGDAYCSPDWIDPSIKAWRDAGNIGYPPEYFKWWEDQIRAMATHYKGKIHDWSFVCEIDLTYPSLPNGLEHYYKMARITYKVLKEVDPTNIMGGVGVSGVDTQGGLVVARKIWENANDAFDAMDFDPYINPCSFGPGFTPIGDERGGFKNILNDAASIVKKYGKHGIAVDEKGFKIIATLPIDSKYAKDLAKIMSRSLVIAKSVKECDRYLYFASDGYWLEGECDWGLWKNENPRPAVMAYATVARLLSNTTNPIDVKLHNDLWIPTFKQGSGSVAVVWTPNDSVINVSIPKIDALDIYDLMGNLVFSHKGGKLNLKVDNKIIFLVSKKSQSVLVKELNTAEFSLPPTINSLTLVDANSAVVHIKNTTNKALSGKLSLSSDGIKINESNIPINIKPEEVVDVPVKINIKDMKTNKFTINGKCVFNNVGSTDFSSEVTLYTSKMKTIDVDGNLSDWDSISPIEMNSATWIFPSGGDAIANKLWLGTNDLSMDVKTAWDDSYFYFSAKVKDDSFVNPSVDANIWYGDGFQFAWDTKNDARKNSLMGKSGFDANDYQLGVVFGAGEVRDWNWSNTNPNYKVGIMGDKLKKATVRNGEDTIYEIAIPWDYLVDIKVKTDSIFTFNICYIDIDKNGDEAKYWMGFAPGISGGKQPELYPYFVLTQ